MPDVFDKVKNLAGPTMRGLTSQFAPSIFKGLLIEYLSKINISDILFFIENDVSLWSKIDNVEKIRKAVAELTRGYTQWLTSDWVIDSIRKDLPRVASLFLGDEKARSWLDKQIIEIKQQVS